MFAYQNCSENYIYIYNIKSQIILVTLCQVVTLWWGLSCLGFLSCQFPVSFWKVTLLSFQVTCPCVSPIWRHPWFLIVSTFVPLPHVYIVLVFPVSVLEHFVRSVVYFKPSSQSWLPPCPCFSSILKYCQDLFFVYGCPLSKSDFFVVEIFDSSLVITCRSQILLRRKKGWIGSPLHRRQSSELHHLQKPVSTPYHDLCLRSASAG